MIKHSYDIINELISSKSLKKPHNKSEIQYIIKNYLNNTINDTEMTRWLKAVCDYGMNYQEAIDYTSLIVNSGTTISFKNQKGYIVDKHSTGGIGDKVSLILGPILAACGCYVPMIVGRSLGHTGGTLDKLESIPNYNGMLSVDKFKQIVNTIGISIIGQTDEICPADKIIYDLRSKTDTIKSYPLICGSIMGKKIAEGINGLVLDIKTGQGAFMDSIEKAQGLGEFLKKIGSEFNINVKYAITDMNQPLGEYSGLLCEVVESIDTLKGNGPKDLNEIVYYLGSIILKMANIDNPRDRIKEVIDDGSAYEKFSKMVYEHGGLLNDIKFNPAEVVEIKAKEGGYLNIKDPVKMGLLLNALGGIQDMKRKIDVNAGFKLLKKHGALIYKNDIIAKLFCSKNNNLSVAKDIFNKSFEISDKKLNSYKLIY